MPLAKLPIGEYLIQKLPSRQRFFKLFRLFFGLSILGVLGYTLLTRSQRLTSRQGNINASVINVRAPLEGRLTLMSLEPGMVLEADTVIGRVENPRQAQITVDQQTTISQIATLQGQLQGLQNRLVNRQGLLGQFQQEARQQGLLQNQFQQQQVNQIRNTLAEAEASARFAAEEARRYGSLADRGAVSRSVAEQAEATAAQTAAAVRQQQAALASSLAEQQAATQGLQLQGSRVFTYPDIRVREVNQEILDLEQQIAEVTITLQAKQRELETITQQLALAQSTAITVPATGVVWSVVSPSGEIGQHINAGDPIIQLLRCEDVWVDAFVAERQLAGVQVGTEARVRLLSDRPGTYRMGTVESIRAGVGRTTTGADVALPPAETVRREAAVRVRLDGAELPFSEFCGVGRSVEVVFPKTGPVQGALMQRLKASQARATQAHSGQP